MTMSDGPALARMTASPEGGSAAGRGERATSRIRNEKMSRDMVISIQLWCQPGAGWIALRLAIHQDHAPQWVAPLWGKMDCRALDPPSQCNPSADVDAVHVKMSDVQSPPG